MPSLSAPGFQRGTAAALPAHDFLRALVAPRPLSDAAEKLPSLFHSLSPSFPSTGKIFLRQHRIISGGVACQKIFCEMIQKAQAILAGLASIFGKYHGKFWRDTPPEPQGANCAVVP